MHNNKGRVLTVVLTIKDSAKADWLWDAMGKEINGVEIGALHNGNLSEKVDLLEEGLSLISYRTQVEDEGLRFKINQGCGDPECAQITMDFASEQQRKYDYDPVLCKYP